MAAEIGMKNTEDETAVYTANSTKYDGVNYEMYDLDEGVLLWDGDSYYRIDD